MKQTPKNPTTAAQRRYYIEFAISVALYVIVLFASRMLWRDVTGPLQIAVALLPMIPVGLVFAAVVRFALAVDELQRQILVESLALAAGITALTQAIALCISQSTGTVSVFKEGRLITDIQKPWGRNAQSL